LTITKVFVYSADVKEKEGLLQNRGYAYFEKKLPFNFFFSNNKLLPRKQLSDYLRKSKT